MQGTSLIQTARMSFQCSSRNTSRTLSVSRSFSGHLSLWKQTVRQTHSEATSELDIQIVCQRNPPFTPVQRAQGVRRSTEQGTAQSASATFRNASPNLLLILFCAVMLGVCCVKRKELAYEEYLTDRDGECGTNKDPGHTY